ncbi:MAG: hypothetical protein ABJA94_07190 [Rhodoglobus sp.]
MIGRRAGAAAIALILGAGLAGCVSTPSLDASADVDANVELHMQQRLDVAWQSIDVGTDRPPSSAAKFVLPNGRNHTVADCMVKAGYSTYSYDPVSGVSEGMNDPKLVGAEGLAWYTCLRKVPQFDVTFPTFTAAQLERLYSYYVDRLIPCLMVSGYPVLVTPSHADFVAGWMSGRPGGWNPYLTGAHLSSGAAADALFERCSPYPSSL